MSANSQRTAKAAEKTANAPAKRSKLRLSLMILLYLAIVSSIVTSITISFYTSRPSGDANATVASFQASTGPTGTQSYSVTLDGLKPGETRSLPVRVTNASDVSISYTISATGEGNLPLTFTTVSGQILLTDANQYRDHALSVSWPADQTDAAYATELDTITLTLQYVQVD